MRLFIFRVLFLGMMVVGSYAEAASSIYSFAPTVGRTVAELHSGWRPYLALGYKTSNGRKQSLIPGQFQKGWVERSANYEVGLEYAPNEFMSAQIKVPASLINSSLDLYFTPIDNLGLGVELGAYPTLYGVISIYPIISLTLTGGVTLPAFGATQRTLGEKESQFLYFVQTSVGLRFLILNAALYGQYSYAPGEGLTAVGDLNDNALARHILSTGLLVKF